MKKLEVLKHLSSYQKVLSVRTLIAIRRFNIVYSRSWVQSTAERADGTHALTPTRLRLGFRLNPGFTLGHGFAVYIDVADKTAPPVLSEPDVLSALLTLASQWKKAE